jgi:hypothetical protein
MSVKTLAQLRAEIVDGFRAVHTYPTSVSARLNDFLTNIVDSMESLYASRALLISGAGVPVDYTDGDPVATGDSISVKGGLYVDTTNGLVYRNSGTAAQPAWTALASVA